MEHKTYCVTGAAGFLGSWLVKTLLEKGYTVHAAVRDTENLRKVGPLKSLPGAAERLKLFRSDLLEDNSFDKAVQGCHGVFHVAGPLQFIGATEDEVVVPAVKGMLNVLKSCIRSKTVKRVVVTSSVSAACPRSEKGELLPCMDEDTWTSLDFFRQSPMPAKFYLISKTLTEQAALKFGEEHAEQIQVLTIQPGNVCGPFLTSELPTTCALLLSPITGNQGLLQTLKMGHQLFGSTPLVHTQDVTDANIFLMENPSAQGRHICSAVAVSPSQLSDYLACHYPNLPLKFQFKKEDDGGEAAGVSSQKLIDMGFEFKHGLDAIVADCVSAAVAHGIFTEQSFSDGEPSLKS